MGLITVKALKPAAGEQYVLGSEYALTLTDLGFNDGSVLQLFSITQTNESGLVLGSDTVHVLQAVNLSNSSDQAFSGFGSDGMLLGAATSTSCDLSFQGS